MKAKYRVKVQNMQVASGYTIERTCEGIYFFWIRRVYWSIVILVAFFIWVTIQIYRYTQYARDRKLSDDELEQVEELNVNLEEEV